MFEQQTVPTILCCLCGIPMPSNPSNMCVNCIRGQVDITEGIPKQVNIYWCRTCGRYLQPPHQWLTCGLESPQLLAFCIKRVKGLSKVKLVDAGWIWTEPHSRRLKVKLTVQKEIFASTILQQVFIVEYVVNTQMCDKCQKVEAKDTWNAVAQVRQKALHKRTFYFLEQTMLKHNAHAQTINIKDQTDGLDFFFAHRSHALKFIDFLQSVVPIRFKTSEHLISHDEHSNVYNYKYTFAVEMVPVCREDLLCLPLKVANSLGFSSPLVLVTKISSLIHMIDPLTLTHNEMNATKYWAVPFRPLASVSRMKEYTILDVTPVGITRGKYVLADVQLARTSDLGVNDNMFYTRTHLGHILQPGDLAMGYDLAAGNYNDDDLLPMKGRQMPDVVIVKKIFQRGNKDRAWKVKRMNIEESDAPKRADAKQREAEYEEFMKDLEEDPELRTNVQLYKKKPAKQAQDLMKDEDGDQGMDDDSADPTFPDVQFDELADDLDELEIEDQDE